MVRITASIHFRGEFFQPGKAEQLTNLVFTNKSEVGDIARTGRYKTLPTPYGAASFDAPNEIECLNRVLWLAQQWVGKIDLVKAVRANDIHFWIGYFYDDQCNCGLSVEEIRAINALSIPYLFSVYQVNDLGEVP